MRSEIIKRSRRARSAMVKITVEAIDLSTDIGPDHTISALMFAAAQVAREAGHTRGEMERWCETALTFFEAGTPSEKAAE
jgi:hypothetical protein